MPELPIPPVQHPIPPFPTDPPVAPLPPGVYPIIGPELATDAVVVPLARELGSAMLGTLHQRIGDTLTPIDANDEGTGLARSPGGVSSVSRSITATSPFPTCQAADRAPDRAGSLAWQPDPGPSRCRGRLLCLWQGRVGRGRAGHQRGGNRLCVDPHRHGGPAGLFRRGILDALRPDGLVYRRLQGTHYTGTAKTEFAEAFRSAAMASSPRWRAAIPLRWRSGRSLCWNRRPKFFGRRSASVMLLTDWGPSRWARAPAPPGGWGAREVDMVTADGQVWQRYGRLYLWHDWNGRAATTFATTPVPLDAASTQLELAVGFTGKLKNRLSRLRPVRLPIRHRP